MELTTLKYVDAHDDRQVVPFCEMYEFDAEQLETHCVPSTSRPLGQVFEQLYVAGEDVSCVMNKQFPEGVNGDEPVSSQYVWIAFVWFWYVHYETQVWFAKRNPVEPVAARHVASQS